MTIRISCICNEDKLKEKRRLVLKKGVSLIKLEEDIDCSNFHVSEDIKDTDVLLVNINCCKKLSTEIEKLKKLKPNIKIIVCSVDNDDNKLFVFNAIKAGAKAYLPHNTPVSEVVRIIKYVNDGGICYPSEITPILINEFRKFSGEFPNYIPDEAINVLSERELEVFGLVNYGLDNREIGDILKISEKTVKNHVTNILNKLGLKNRVHLVLYAKKLGM